MGNLIFFERSSVDVLLFKKIQTSVGFEFQMEKVEQIKGQSYPWNWENQIFVPKVSTEISILSRLDFSLEA